MYIPPLPDDPDEIAAHAISFGRPHQIRTGDLHLADRVAALSLLGWRIFGSFSRMVYSRANEREVLFREALEHILERRDGTIASEEPATCFDCGLSGTPHSDRGACIEALRTARATRTA